MRLWFLLAGMLAGPAFAQPVPLSGFSDEGAFLLYFHEDPYGRVTFQWKPDGHFENAFTLTVAGKVEWRSNVNLTPDAEGRWIRSAVENTQRKVYLERTGNTLKITGTGIDGKGQMPEDMLSFAEDAPALLSQALLRYDRKAGGKQTFGLIDLIKTDGAPLTVERQDAEDRTVGGRSLKLVNWLLAKPGYELHLLAGEDARVYVVTGVPGYAEAGVSEHHTCFVREGYEALRPKAPDDPLISGPRYEVKLETVKIPMRDGVNLATDIYFPVGVTKAPVILTRTPYSKEGGIRGRFYAHRGYIYAIQDVRGRFQSEGQWEGLINEPKDGYDTIEWLARQPWSTGKVGMVGGSYLGWVQWLAAIEHPPHLVTIVPNVSPPDPFHNLPFDHGVMALSLLAPWFTIIENNLTGPPEGQQPDYGKLLQALPVIDLDKALLGRESLSWRHWLTHPTADSYWRPVMFADKLKDVRIPVFHQSGWFDGDGIGTKLNYLAMAAAGRSPQKMIVGPWPHADIESRTYDGQDFGAAAVPDLQREYLRWFDYWLKGMDNGILQEPLVGLFVMGPNKWLYGPKYPLPQTRFEKLYLAGAGRLSFTPPEAGQKEDRYVYDPGDPTPDPGNDSSGRVKEVAARKDILVYTTSPFDKPYTIAGPLSAVLYASSSARDTDWFVHLMDVDADGGCTLLWANNSGGQVRARYRNSVVKTELIEPGKVYKYTIDLWHTGITIAAGHRLRVEVASAAFPTFARNLNTGGNNETETRFVPASQAIYHDAKRPSYILLPRIPE